MDYLGMKYKFESAIGLNGRVWIKAASLASTLLISNTLNKLQHTSEKQIVSEFQFWSWTILGLLLINVNRCKVYIVNRLSSISSMVFVSQNLCVCISGPEILARSNLNFVEFQREFMTISIRLIEKEKLKWFSRETVPSILGYWDRFRLFDSQSLKS